MIEMLLSIRHRAMSMLQSNKKASFNPHHGSDCKNCAFCVDIQIDFLMAQLA